MLTPYLPYPPSSGGQVRSYNLIKHLSDKHEITLFSLIKEDKEKKYISELEKYCSQVQVFRRPPKPWTINNILRTGFGPYPFLVVRNLSGEERGAVSRILQEQSFDLIHAETFYVMPHIPKTDIPVLLVEQTIEYRVYQHFVKSFKIWPLKPLLYLDVFKLRYWESRFWREASGVVAVSESDKREMLKLVPSLKVSIVPNGAGEDLLAVWRERSRKKEKKPIIFYQGNFSWLQNTEAANILAHEIFPLIKKEITEAECWIVGQGAKDKIGGLAGNGVKVKELETSDIGGVKDAYREATVFIAPLRGPGGTRLKILGAMAAGVPMVTTSVGIQGIGAKDGREVLVRDKNKEMAQAAVQLIKEPKLYERIVFSAKKLVDEKYSWTSIAKRLDEIYKEVGDAKRKS